MAPRKKDATPKPRTNAEWCVFIEQAIVRSQTGKKVLVKTKDGSGMHSQNTMSWIAEVISAIVAEFPKKGMYDPNMRLAARLGTILLVWYTRIHRAKTFDSRRPVKIRKESYESWIANVSYILTALLDDRTDAAVWGNQPWVNPYLKGAKGGKFV